MKIPAHLSLFCLAALTLLLGASPARAQGREAVQTVYTFTVGGLKTQADAIRLDSLFLKKKGIVSCDIRLADKSATLHTKSWILYSDLVAVMRGGGFEASENYTAKSESP